MKKLLTIAVLLAVGSSLFGATFYVSQSRGKKKGPGTVESPFRAIPDAIKAAAPGDVICVSEGTYTGKMGASEIIVDKSVAICGGYSADFTARDVVKYKTLIQPVNKKNDTKGIGLLTLNPPSGPGPDLIIDGLVIDQGYMNSYHDVKGKPAGVETGMWLEPPAKGSKDTFASAKSYSIYKETKNRFIGNIIIQNCVIANAGNFGVNISHHGGTVRILNNVFVACRMESCEVSSSHAAAGTVVCEFAYNTVLFTWSRLSDLADMGYGFRCMSKVKSVIHHNIFGLNVFSGIGNDKGDPKTKNVFISNNIFFLNKKSDVTAVKSPNIIHLRVDSEEFEDLEDFPGMGDVSGNVALKDPAVFKGRLNSAYLTAFLNASYSEKLDYDENSPANIFRSAMGMNKVGKITTKVSMFGNRYPLAEVFKLFGAVKTHGAQIGRAHV